MVADRVSHLRENGPASAAIQPAILLTGDCREKMPARGPYDLIIADPPYGVTRLRWDRQVDGWLAAARASLRPGGSIWVFGSLRSFMMTAGKFASAGFRYAQEVVWEKPNGSGMAADRFRRVHEIVVQFYRKDTKWREVHNCVQRVPAVHKHKSIRRLGPDRFAHAGRIAAHEYHDDGTRIMRSIIHAKSPRTGVHPTSKPVDLLEILIRTSCPPGGIVGDWFAGSGAAGEACLRSGRRYVGCEIDPVMANTARRRLAAVESSLSGDRA